MNYTKTATQNSVRPSAGEQQKYATMVQRPGDKHFLSAMLDETSSNQGQTKIGQTYQSVD
jgi:hypothetical protein